MDDLNQAYESEKDPEKKMELRKQIHEELQSRSEYTFDLDNLPEVKHKWVRRGLVMSCEAGTHPSHRVFLRSES